MRKLPESSQSGLVPRVTTAERRSTRRCAASPHGRARGREALLAGRRVRPEGGLRQAGSARKSPSAPAAIPFPHSPGPPSRGYRPYAWRTARAQDDWILRFAYAAGDDSSQVVPDAAWDEPGGSRYGGGLSSGPARRIPNSRRATLHALDALTGKELWSSGMQIESWNHFSGLTVANGRAYIATYDGVLYAFGVPR